MKKRLVIIILLILVVVGVGVAAVTAFVAQSQMQQVREAESHYQSALEHYNKREWQSAKFETETALKLNSAHCCAAELQAKVALELDLEKRYADAQDKRSTSNFCAAADDFGWVYARRKTYKQVSQNILETTQRCAGALLAQGNYQDAMGYLHIADDIEVNPQTKALLSKLDSYQTGINSINAQRWDEAIAALSPVYQADANFLLTRANLCAALVQRGLVSEAKSDWDAARSDFNQALTIKGDCAGAEGYKQRINARLYAQWIEQCQSAKSAKDYATAGALGNKALEINPQSAEAQECIKGPEPIFTTVASSLQGFSGAQGQNGWSYWMTVNSCVSLPTSTYDLLFWNADDHQWQPPLGPPWVRIEADSAHPNRCNDVVRRWKSTVGGQIRILITLRKTSRDDYQGNGVKAYISVNHNPTPAWSYNLDCCNYSALNNYPVLLTVQQGTEVDFGLNSRGDTVSDHTTYVVIIQRVTYN